MPRSNKMPKQQAPAQMPPQASPAPDEPTLPLLQSSQSSRAPDESAPAPMPSRPAPASSAPDESMPSVAGVLQSNPELVEALRRALADSDSKVYDQVRGAFRLVSGSTRCGIRAGELARRCPELADLMDGVLKGQLDDQATAQEALRVLALFANERDLEIPSDVAGQTATPSGAAQPASWLAEGAPSAEAHPPPRPPAGSSGAAQPAGPVVLSVADLERVPRVPGLGGKTACEWQRTLREHCIATEVSDKDVTDDPLYNWKGVLCAASRGFAERIIGPGILRVSFRIIDSEIDNNYSNTDGHGRHVFEFLRTDGSARRLHYHQNGKPDRPTCVGPQAFVLPGLQQPPVPAGGAAQPAHVSLHGGGVVGPSDDDGAESQDSFTPQEDSQEQSVL